MPVSFDTHTRDLVALARSAIIDHFSGSTNARDSTLHIDDENSVYMLFLIN